MCGYLLILLKNNIAIEHTYHVNKSFNIIMMFIIAVMILIVAIMIFTIAIKIIIIIKGRKNNTIFIIIYIIIIIMNIIK